MEVQVRDEAFFKNDTVWPPYQYASKEVHFTIGTMMVIVGLTGILGNSLVLIVFTRFKRLSSPVSSCLIVNLAIADFGNSCLHLMVAASSFNGKWYFGHAGCVLYAFGVGCFGLMSIFTLAAISVERYMVIAARPLSRWKMTKHIARQVCAASWFYSLSLTVPPMFGWSRYTIEGLLTSCSWDYTTRSWNNTSYYVYLVTLGFVVPVGVITFCYSFIISAVLAHGREMAAVKRTSGSRRQRRYRPTPPSRSSAIRTGEIILVLIAIFLLSWTPYALVTLVAQFDNNVITPWIAALPAYFAKMSVIYNPIVYGLSHPHFRSSVKQYISTCRFSGTHDSEIAQQPIRCNHDQHYRCFPLKQTEETALDDNRSIGNEKRSVIESTGSRVKIIICDTDL